MNTLAIGQTRIFKISPAENWRNIRAAQRIVAGYDPDNAGVSHDYLTAGAGVTVYRGDAYPPEFERNILLGKARETRCIGGLLCLTA